MIRHYHQEIRGKGEPVTARSNDEVEEILEELSAHGLGDINPDQEQFRAILASDLDGPLQFVNLLGYYDEARYPADHRLSGAGLSGAEAYGRYGTVAVTEISKRGGRLDLFNDVKMVIAGDNAAWDQVVIMEYPSIDSFIDMVRAPEYVEGLVHRNAGLERTVVLATRSLLG